MVACYHGGRLKAHSEVTEELERMRSEAIQVQEKQELLTDAFVKAWEIQQSEVHAITEAADYIRQRNVLVSKNRREGPTEFLVGRR